ncbi:ankyrin repeat domain-containing protein [Estrella lausannensis]|uniref:Uncharacterized protein n=1 Tax=Estrella lausannensis TaxID=483423 RepID=A0A0H5DT88_9BACT|nr:ankyrin repeat domain-containing protein [Estrella lausannensis]CRX39573.1 hypothetical protein ELAC_2253 [Estrella lausannensis]
MLPVSQSQAEFSNTISQYQTIADKITPKTVTESVDTVVFKFASTILANQEYLQTDNPKIAHTLNQYKQLADTRCSPEVRAKMNEVFEQVFNSRTERFNEGMDHLLHHLPRSDVASFAEIHTEDGIPAAVLQLKEVLQDPSALLKFVTHGDKQFVSNMLFLCDIDVGSSNASGSTLLHLAASLKDGAKAVTALAEYGAHLEAMNGDRQTPLETAIHANHLPTIKAFVRAGAKIPPNFLSLNGNLSLDAQKYLAKNIMGQAASHLPRPTAEILTPPAKLTPGGFAQAALDYGALAIGQLPTVAAHVQVPASVAAYVTPMQALVPALKEGSLSIEESKLGKRNVALEEKVAQLREKIDQLDVQISQAKEPAKSALIKEKNRLQQDIGVLKEHGRKEARNSELEVYKKHVAFFQGTQGTATAFAGELAGVAAQGAKALTNASGLLATTFNALQNINDIHDLRLRRERLQDIATSLNSAYGELGAFYSQISAGPVERNNLLATLVEMKMSGVYEQSVLVQKEIDKLSSEIQSKGVLAGANIASTLMMGYACYQFYNRVISGDTSVGINAAVDNAAHIPLVVGIAQSAIPSIGSALSSGVGWLWNKAPTLRSKPPVPVEADAPYRVTNNDAKQMQGEKKRLESERTQIERELEGYEIALGTFEKPEPGSKEHTQLTERAAFIDSRLTQIGKDLRQWERHATADKEHETNLTKDKSNLESELDRVYHDLYVGYEIAFAAFEKPEPGSKEHTELTNKANDLEGRLARVDQELKEHQMARQVGMTREQFNERFNALKGALGYQDGRDFIYSLVKANGTTEAEFNEDPEGCLMKFFTT